MKTSKLRVIIPVAIIALVAIGFATHAGIGTLSSLGWQDIALICPVGALSTMLAAKTMIPRAVISLIIAVIAIVLIGKAFCAWVCPVPVVSKLRDLFSKKKPAENKAAGETVAPLTKAELESLSTCSSTGCSSCAQKRSSLDSRHFVLGGSLLSAAIFGFPVFCLICPIGLTFATILLVMRLFTDGDLTWAVVVVPTLLLAEIVFFRKWCHAFCPLGALMGLVAKFNRTLQPVVDKDTCLESNHGAHCGKCASVCPEGIDPRNVEAGAPMSECTRCRACVENCPSGAISMPLLAPKSSPRTIEEPDPAQQ